jgi:hypothetical protein
MLSVVLYLFAECILNPGTFIFAVVTILLGIDGGRWLLHRLFRPDELSELDRGRGDNA